MQNAFGGSHRLASISQHLFPKIIYIPSHGSPASVLTVLVNSLQSSFRAWQKVLLHVFHFVLLGNHSRSCPYQLSARIRTATSVVSPLRDGTSTFSIRRILNFYFLPAVPCSIKQSRRNRHICGLTGKRTLLHWIASYEEWSFSHSLTSPSLPNLIRKRR